MKKLALLNHLRLLPTNKSLLPTRISEDEDNEEDDSDFDYQDDLKYEDEYVSLASNEIHPCL